MSFENDEYLDLDADNPEDKMVTASPKRKHRIFSGCAVPITLFALQMIIEFLFSTIFIDVIAAAWINISTSISSQLSAANNYTLFSVFGNVINGFHAVDAQSKNVFWVFFFLNLLRALLVLSCLMEAFGRAGLKKWYVFIPFYNIYWVFMISGDSRLLIGALPLISALVVLFQSVLQTELISYICVLIIVILNIVFAFQILFLLYGVFKRYNLETEGVAAAVVYILILVVNITLMIKSRGPVSPPMQPSTAMALIRFNYFYVLTAVFMLLISAGFCKEPVEPVDRKAYYSGDNAVSVFLIAVSILLPVCVVIVAFLTR